MNPPRRDAAKARYLVAIPAIVIGIAAIVAGEADDSPGLQLLGVVFIVGTVALGVVSWRRRRRGAGSP